MKPTTRKPPIVRINWNGGRNGHASFLVGAAWMPKPELAPKWGWTVHLYLGLWVLVIKGGATT